jgi:hypothetical protein
MHVSGRLAGAVAAALVAASAVVFSAPPAFADISCGTGASVDHSVNSAQTFVQCFIRTYPANTPPSGTPSFVHWTPPVCWLEPQWSGAGLQSLIEGSMATVGPGNAYYSYLEQLDNLYKSANPPYHVGDDGMWWGVGCRTDDLTAASVFLSQQAADGLSANNPYVWFPAATPVNLPNPVTGQILAEYAAAELVPPVLTFQVNPGVLQTVNLSTRVYSGAATGPYQPISAEALIGPFDSIVDATPSSVTITPGGPASRTVGGPAVGSITCPIVNGAFGSKDDDSCAFYYTKATPNGVSYHLTASITWTYTWRGHPNAAGFPVDVTVAAAPQNVTVQEVQAIVGGQQP